MILQNVCHLDPKTQPEVL